MDEQLQQQREQQQQQRETTTIRLAGREDYVLNGRYDQTLFDFQTNQTETQINQEYESSQRSLRELKTDAATHYTYKRKREVENTAFNALRAKLYKDKWSWFLFSGKDSPEMDRVKKTMNLVTNLINMDLSAYIDKKEDGASSLNASALREKLNTALQECIDACDNYFRKKKEQGGGKTSAGKRRLDLVKEVQKHCRAEKRKFGALIDSLKEKSGMENNTLQEIGDRSLQRLTTEHLTLEAKDLSAEWQNEGNSTDVYKITATDGTTNYYIKQNIPLISEDISGFLDRRSRQLTTSLQYKQSEEEKEKEERRLSEAKLKPDEYKLALDFIGLLGTRIQNAAPADLTDVERRVTSFLAFDFDKMFRDLRTHNEAAEHANDQGQDWEKIATRKNDPLSGVAQYILMYRGGKGGEAANAAPLERKTAKQWVTEKLKLDATKDRDILALFDGKTDEAIKRLFCISLGKEVELFGQIRERQGSEPKEIAASNNIATYQLARQMGFTDVITTSENRVVKFRDRTGKVVEDFCTVMEEAKGDEFVNLIKKAEKENKVIHYTPDAIRQLMRLQAFDIVCNQTDRHGRNFKCDYEEGQDGSLIIKNIKSYDHDNSFGEGSIEKLLAGEKNGFLPGMNKTLKKYTAEYQYVNRKYFGIKSPVWMDQATEPKFRGFYFERGGERKTPYKNVPKTQTKNLQYNTAMGQVLVKHKHWNYKDSFLSEEAKGGDWHGPIFRRDKNKSDDVYPAEDHKIGGEEYEEVSAKLDSIYSKLREMLEPRRNDTPPDKISNNLRTDLTKEEKQDVFRLMGDLHDLNEKYDFSALLPTFEEDKHWGADLTGFMDLWIQSMLYTYANLFREDPDLADVAAEVTEKVYTDEQKKQRKEDMKTLQNDNGDLVIPSLLHFDYESYVQIQRIADGGAENAQMEADLKLLNFSDEKIQGIKQRCQATLEFLKEAKKKAEAFYRLAGWDKEPQNQFYLKKEDYDKIEDLSQLSVDPGNTYLSVDNEHYLFGQEEFTKYAKEEDKKKALEEEVLKRKDKRWHDKNYGDGEEAKKKFYGNPLKSNIVKMPGNMDAAV